MTGVTGVPLPMGFVVMPALAAATANAVLEMAFGNFVLYGANREGVLVVYPALLIAPRFRTAFGMLSSNNHPPLFSCCNIVFVNSTQHEIEDGSSDSKDAIA